MMLICHYVNVPVQYTAKLMTVEINNLKMKNLLIFFAQSLLFCVIHVMCYSQTVLGYKNFHIEKTVLSSLLYCFIFLVVLFYLPCCTVLSSLLYCFIFLVVLFYLPCCTVLSSMLYYFIFLVVLFYYAPNFEKVGSILVSACASVRSSLRPFKKKFKLGF